ncbi:MAG: zinc-dependent metalloprotease, partial [Actinomadura sp.]
REAGALWRALTDARGIDGRDAVWQHPDLMPTADDLADPEAFVRGESADTDFDISALTEPPGDEPDEPGGDAEPGPR